MKKQKIIMYDDPDIVEYRENLKGWVSNGLFYGDNKDSESIARYSACTHKVCSCGEIMKKYYTACSKCREKNRINRWEKMPFKDYDYKSPLYSDYLDEYFENHGIFCDYCYDEHLNPADMNLIICDYEYCEPIDPYDYYVDKMPEDCEDLPDYVVKAFDKLNDELSKYNEPISYFPGKYRTIIDCR